MAMVYWKKGRVARSSAQIGDDGPAFASGSKHRNKWVAVVEPEESADGRRHWITVPVSGDTNTKKGKRAAQAWLQAHLTEQLKMKAAGVLPTEDRTVKQLVDEYLKARSKQNKPCRESDIARVFLRFKVGNSQIATMSTKAVRKQDVQAYLNSRLERSRTLPDGTIKTRKGSPGNAERHRAMLLTVFDEGKVIPNPVAETLVEAHEDKRHREMTKEEQDRMAPFLNDEMHCPGLARLGRIISFALFSLMRKEEILRVRWRDIDLTERTEPDGATSYGKITVLSEGEEQTKGRRTRIVELWPELKDLLLVMRAEAMTEVGGLPAAIEDRHIFLSADGTQYKSIKVTWQNLLKKAGIRNLWFHDLRRTGTMRYYRLGVEPLVLKEMLGHSSIEVTMRYLGLVGKEQARPLNRAWARKQELQAAAISKAN